MGRFRCSRRFHTQMVDSWTWWSNLISQAGWNRCNRNLDLSLSVCIYLHFSHYGACVLISMFLLGIMVFWDLPGHVLAAPNSAL